MGSRFSKIKNWYSRKKFTFLLISLLLYTIIAPFFEGVLDRSFLINVTFLIFLFTAVSAVSSNKKELLFVSTIACLSILLTGFRTIFDSDYFLVTNTLTQIVLYMYLIYIITGYAYRCDTVSRDTISASMIGYILLSMLWTKFYFLLEMMYPNSFTISHEIIMKDPAVFRYFSFVTITTLGYGDISPVSAQARNLTISEAFLGQMYVAVLIARLVAIHTSQKS